LSSFSRKERFLFSAGSALLLLLGLMRPTLGGIADHRVSAKRGLNVTQLQRAAIAPVVGIRGS